ncbi:MAG: response regulator, partial [Alphaproteobacteria bacterium]|nr:response regulator [Alphaproteobacteria bacterium]
MTSSILIVDDEQVWARNLARYLERQGFEAASAQDIRRAETMIERDRPSLLCLDLRLPDGDGLELLDRLRAKGDRTPCLLITGHASDATYAEAKRLDAAVIEKPARLAEISRRISRMLADVKIAADKVSERRGAGAGDASTKMVVMYSHDGFGLGHMRRNLNLARALTADPGINVLMLIGCPNGLFFDLPPRIDFIKLPSIVKVDTESWETRKLTLGMETTCALRAGLILHTLKTLNPDLFLVDYVPQGVGRELLPGLDWIRAQPKPPQTVLGLRDIIDQPERLTRTWTERGTYDVIEAYYDRVMIYGHRHVFDGADAYGLDRLF